MYNFFISSVVYCTVCIVYYHDSVLLKLVICALLYVVYCVLISLCFVHCVLCGVYIVCIVYCVVCVVVYNLIISAESARPRSSNPSIISTIS